MHMDQKADEATDSLESSEARIKNALAATESRLMLRITSISAQIFDLTDRLNEVEENILREIADDRQRLTAVEIPRKTTLQERRAEELKSILRDNGGVLLGQQARDLMKMAESDFSRLLATMTDEIHAEKSQFNKRKNMLILYNDQTP